MIPIFTPLLISAVTSVTLLLSSLTGAPSLQATQADPPAEPPTEVPTSQPAVVDPVEALLDRLAVADADLDSIVADIKTTKKEKILRRTEIRIGKVIYDVDELTDSAEPESEATRVRRFAILFNMRYAGSGTRLRQDVRDDHYIFDGRWLADVNHTDKQFIKYEVAAPGEERDPLKLGEGPLPLPIGQPKEDVLRRFNASLIDVPTEGPFVKLDRERVQGLKLVPKPNTKVAEDWNAVHLFYDLDLNLPIGIEVMHANGDIEQIELMNVKRNEALNDVERAKLNITTPPSPPWRIDIRPWGS